MYFGAENQVGVTLPDFKLMFLGGADSAADDLEYVGGSAALSIFEAYGNADDVGRTELAGGAGGNLGDETAIRKAARSDLYGFEQPRESTASANRFAEITVSEDHGFSIGKIRCNDGHRDFEIFEVARFENLLDEVREAMITGET